MEPWFWNTVELHSPLRYCIISKILLWSFNLLVTVTKLKIEQIKSKDKSKKRRTKLFRHLSIHKPINQHHHEAVIIVSLYCSTCSFFRGIGIVNRSLDYRYCWRRQLLCGWVPRYEQSIGTDNTIQNCKCIWLEETNGWIFGNDWCTCRSNRSHNNKQP